MRDILDLCFVQHCECSNSPAVIQCVPQHLPVLLSLLLLLLLLLLLSLPLLLLPLLLLLFLPLLPQLLGEVWLTGSTDEAFCPPLDFVQEVEVALCTSHPRERCILHDGPNLSLVKGQEPISIKEVFQPAQECHLLRRFSSYFFEVTVEEQPGIHLNTKDAYAVL